MNEVYIKYNPYLVRTDFLLNGKPISKISEFYNMKENVRLQEWIEPMGHWKGLYPELFSYFNSRQPIHIKFHGTKLDFQDLKYAAKKYGNDFEKIEFTFIPGKEQDNRLEVLKNQYQKVKEGRVEELKDKKIEEMFEKALSSEFEIVVIAPMSSGKSTLINAMLGTNILPARNGATTAVITKVKDVSSQDGYQVFCTDRDGKKIKAGEKADLKTITELNEKANEEKKIDLIEIRGTIPNLHSEKNKIVFVDTPGGNYVLNKAHDEIMNRAVRDENKGMILFVFNFAQLGTDDMDDVFQKAARAMEDTKTGKQSRDRFIFVCNRMGDQDPENEPIEKTIKKVTAYLEEQGIREPNLFFTDAKVCKLVRMAQAGMEMTQAEEDALDGCLKPFNRQSRRYFLYDSISDEKKNEFLKEVDDIAKTGERESFRAAEINSGIPALETAIRQYIEKYAQAIKIKTAHDIFMNRVEELDMKATCEAKWSESEEAYKNMRQELKKKKEILEKDQTLQEFKEKVDAIRGDYAQVKKLQEKIVKDVMEIPSQYPEKIRKKEAEDVLKDCSAKFIQIGTEAQNELGKILENSIYKECKKIIQEYDAYIYQMDRNGLLNIGNYSLKKITGIDELIVSKVESIPSEFVHNDVIGYEKVKNPGIANAIKRLFGMQEGWHTEYKTTEMISLREMMRSVISDVENVILDKLEEEIERAKKNEQNMKNIAKNQLGEINEKVREELKNVEEATKNEEELRKRAERNKENMEWLSEIVNEMNTLLDI